MTDDNKTFSDFESAKKHELSTLHDQIGELVDAFLKDKPLPNSVIGQRLAIAEILTSNCAALNVLMKRYEKVEESKLADFLDDDDLDTLQAIDD